MLNFVDDCLLLYVLWIEVFWFDGSYLLVVVCLFEVVLEGLGKWYVVCLDLLMCSDWLIGFYVWLNVKVGLNVG